MMKKMTLGKKQLVSSGGAIAIGIGFSVLITLLITAGLAALIISSKLQESTVGIIVAIIRAIAVFLGVMITTKIKQDKILQSTGIVAGLYVLIILGLGILLYDGSFNSFGIGLLSILVGALAAYLIRIKPNKRKHTSRRIR